MTVEAETEYERVRRKYAPARPRDLAVFALVMISLVVASIFGEADWAFVVGGAIGFAFWEFTKFRLRRNAREFAYGSR